MSNSNELDDPRRRILIKALSAGALMAGVGGREALARGFFGSVPEQLPPTKSIYSIKGKVLVNGQEANMNTIIHPNDTVETGSQSEVIFVVGGHSMIVRENSTLKMAGKEEHDSFLIQGLRMLTGKVLAVSRSQGTQIRTATATIGIRGTGYYIEAEPDRTYFCTCYGLTEVESTEDPSSHDTVASKHHDKPLYIMGNEAEGKNIRPAPFINHTDHELMLIEALVGRTPPFVFAGDEYSAPRREY